MSDLALWREQRRKDRQDERAQDRADRAAVAEQQRAARREEREQDRADRAAARAEKRRDKAERAVRWQQYRAWLAANGALVCTGLVMVCAIVPALSAQFAALSTSGLGPLLAALLATMLEGGAWAATFGAATAARADRPTGRYRAATWACAVVAAGINFWHGSHDYGLWLGVVLAAASLFAVGMWELHLHGAHAPSRAERDRARHARRRRRHHRKVWRTARRLITAAPFGTLPAEDAFAAAWRIHHGAAPGTTASLLNARLAAEARLGEVLERAADRGPQRVSARLWSTFDDALPTLGPVVPLPAPASEEAAQDAADRSPSDLQKSTPSPTALRVVESIDLPRRESAESTRTKTVAAAGHRPRRATGRVPQSARTPRPTRTAEELLAEARQKTADWSEDELSAEPIRKAVRTSAANARMLRDVLKAERAQATAEPDEAVA